MMLPDVMLQEPAAVHYIIFQSSGHILENVQLLPCTDAHKSVSLAVGQVHGCKESSIAA